MTKAKVVPKKRGSSRKPRGGGGKSTDSHRFEAQCRAELETPSKNTANPPLLKRKKPSVKEPSSKRAKPSPAAIPQTPDAPIPSPARNDIDMEDVGGQFDLIPEANPTTEATANDVVQSEKASDSFQGQMADASAGSSLFWR
jgi:hypothetical protein